jgi:hypothetical protein
LGVVHLLSELGIDGLHSGVKGSMGQFAHRTGQRAGLLSNEFDDQGVEGVGHGCAISGLAVWFVAFVWVRI